MFLPRTEEVNRHLKRDSPGLIVQQFLARHFQQKTLDSEVLFKEAQNGFIDLWGTDRLSPEAEMDKLVLFWNYTQRKEKTIEKW